ncbi:TRAPP trafficking subunit Trs65-domain-containing protein [Sphaerosporella brunnea]|uniref:TRAPP trafficking subunit Trs65-domain-containing protein n=1 Tax=Sphaerosporella brunnea TaxID=1250544 RepID=A0A5J5EIM8_9PEZI|nr:TRAPP trafficking subunit Trs65-domain-containing protein [Sphaerosporella brunnea]
MSAGKQPRGHNRNLSTEISETARLDLIVPHASNLNIEEAVAQAVAKAEAEGSAVQGNTASNIPLVAHIEQRNNLFYDEKLPVFIVLQILVPLSDELYERYLARIAVSLEVAAIDGHKPQHGPPGRNQETVHMLFQTTVNEEETPRISVGESTKRLAVWKLEVPLGHPRARLNNPRVLLTCSATLRPAELQKPLFEDDYMASRQPMGINLLESFAEDPLMSHSPRLSAHRVSRVIPVTQAPQQAIRPIGYAAKRGFNIYPAINIRLRYSRIPSGNRHIVIASLDLEVTPFSHCSVTINSVNIAVAGGSATLVADSPSTELPVTCLPRDDMTFLYTLAQTDINTESAFTTPAAPGTQVRAISVSLEATALVSDTCRPCIFTNWTTTVDFAPPAAPHFPSHAGIQRAHRPPSLGAIVHGATVQASSGIRPGNPPPGAPPAPSPNVVFSPPKEPRPGYSSGIPSGPPTQGLTVTFTGPSRVYVGEAFTWSVFVVNRSSRMRKLALIVPPKRKRMGENKSLPAMPSNETPEPVIDETMVYQSHRSRYLEPAELVPLVNDIRIGPLMPSACHTTELKFVPLTTGLLTLEGVRVVDLNTNETTECRELPSIVSVGKRTPPQISVA